MKSSSPVGISRTRAAVVLAALSSFLCAFVLTAAPALHEHIHFDAAHPQHECAITVVETGVESHDAPLTIAAPQAVSLFSNVSALRSVWVPALLSHAHVFAHAPPAHS